MFDSIIFDVDGTIWDTTPVVAAAWNEALAECAVGGVTITADMLKGLFGLPMESIIEAILPNESGEKRAEFKRACYKKEAAYVERERIEPYPNMRQSLERLAQKYALFIVSNCQSGYIELMLKKTGFAPYFKDFACYGDRGILKAENIRLVAERNKLRAPVYVGDTQSDADACKKAGVPIVHAAYGFGKIESPDFVVDDIAQLEAVLQG